MVDLSREHPVLNIVEKFAEKMQHVSEIKRYRLAEHQIKTSATVERYIDTIKKKQKELVHAKHYQKREYISHLEKELELLQSEFDELPIIKEYQQAQVSVNEILQTIQEIIAQEVSKKIRVETGGEVLKGCGSGGSCGCSSKK